jgi:arabinogalactan oligomer/maltooligosaccharide transport system substrate-binding protein
MLAKPEATYIAEVDSSGRRQLMRAIGICRLSCALGLMTVVSGCTSSIKPPVVLKIVRTVNTAETVTTEDYDRVRKVTEEVIDNIKGVDASIRPQLTLSSRENFIEEISKQTRSGFGPDLLITDSDTALELYRRKLVDPIELTPEDRSNIPQHLFDLATAADGNVVGRPVNQFIQLACFNTERLAAAPTTLEALRSASDDGNFGLALQLKDLFWSAEAFDAGDAFEAAFDQKGANAEQRRKVTDWLQWLESASYQQNIRFLSNQSSLREALIAGEMDWITCWSSNRRQLREAMDDKLGVAPLPQGPSKRLKAATRLQVWSLGRNSSPMQRRKALVLTDFISKPWAQKTYALTSRTSLPVHRKAARIVASKIPGGTEALVMYSQKANEEKAAEGQIKARVFRDPEQYATISEALLDTVYDVITPEEATEDILESLQESRR